MSNSPDKFAKSVLAAGLSSAEEIKAVWNSLPADQRPIDGKTFAKILVEHKKLTPFQATEILSGSATPLVLGEYVLLSKIGAGGMGQVFKAHHRRMKRMAAIKLLPNSLTNNNDAVRRFEREVEAAAKLSHPNIVQTYDAGVQQGVWYLVMEYVEGIDLSGIASTAKPLPVIRAVDFIRQAAKGLAFAHASGVIHRDIKPANLLLDKQGTIKILDMGLARIDDDFAPQIAEDGLTQSGQVMGTVDYMAPEQAFDSHHADARADIYSLGCTLYRLLSGKNIYDGETMVQKLMAHQSKPIPSLAALRADIPVTLVPIFERMVAKKPEQRFQTMVAVENSLTTFLTNPSMLATTTKAKADSQPTTFFHPLSGQSNQLQSAPVNVAILTSHDFESNGIDGTAPTVSLASPLHDTDPVSKRSIQIARLNTARICAAKRPPTWQLPFVLSAGALGGMLLLAMGTWVIIRDKDGKEVSRVEVPEGGSATVQSQEKTTPLLPEKGKRTVVSSAAVDRAAAEALIPYANLDVEIAGQKQWIPFTGNLPSEPFTLVGIDFHNIILPADFVETVFLPTVMPLGALNRIEDFQNMLSIDLHPQAVTQLATATCGKSIRRLALTLIPTPHVIESLQKFPRLEAVRFQGVDDEMLFGLKTLPPTVKTVIFYRFGNDKGEVTERGQAALATLPLENIGFEYFCDGINRRLFELLSTSAQLKTIDLEVSGAWNLNDLEPLTHSKSLQSVTLEGRVVFPKIDKLTPPSNITADLLPLIDPAIQSRKGIWKRGNWEKNGASLYSSLGSEMCLELPINPTSQYRIEAVAERLEGDNSLEFGLVVGANEVELVLDGWGSNITGLHEIRSTDVPQQAVQYEQRIFVAGTPTKIVIEVSTNSILARCDGKTIVDWHGKPEDLSIPDWHTRGLRVGPRALFLSTIASQYRITQLTYTPLAEAATQKPGTAK